MGKHQEQNLLSRARKIRSHPQPLMVISRLNVLKENIKVDFILYLGFI